MVRFTFQCNDKWELLFPLQILTTAYEYRSDKMNDTCILIGSSLLSIVRLEEVYISHIRQIYSTLPWISTVIDYRRFQNKVRT